MSSTKYIVTRICDVPKRNKIFHDPGWRIEDYCGLAAALNSGIVTKEVQEQELCWSYVADWLWLNPSNIVSLAITRVRRS